MFGARHEGHEAQAGSGYAAYIGGAVAVSTDEQGEWWGSRGLGTVPHALIAVYGGDTTVATLKFDEYVNRVYQGPSQATVGLYLGFYESQRRGRTMHSPLNCLPGAGWVIIPDCLFKTINILSS